MMSENISLPDRYLIMNDEIYLFYEMMLQALQTENVKEGVNKSLFLLHTFLGSGNVVLYKKSKNKMYRFHVSDSPLDDYGKMIQYIVNKSKNDVEHKGILNIDLNLSNSLKEATLINLNVEDTEFILAIINNNKVSSYDLRFWKRLIDTMIIILKREIIYEKSVAAITTDLLTGLENRNSYEMMVQAFNEASENIIIGIFDLFRLKYINDNYNHEVGDLYIKKAASILNRYWPKYQTTITEGFKEELTSTGHCIYRIGGDEFVLLTSVDNFLIAETKAKLAADESHLMRLKVDDDVKLGLNYGIVHHEAGDSFKKTFIRADEIMQKDKEKMYKKYNLDRRR